MRTSEGILIAAVVAVGGTAVIMKVLFSITAVAVWLAMMMLKVVIFVIIAAVVFAAVYFKLKRRSISNK